MPHTLVDISQLHPCPGTFLNDFTVPSETTRTQVVRAFRYGAHHIDAASDRYIHDSR